MLKVGERVLVPSAVEQSHPYIEILLPPNERACLFIAKTGQVFCIVIVVRNSSAVVVR